MKDTDYAYCVARVRAVEGTLLKKEDYKKLLSADNLESAEKILLEKHWIGSDKSAISEYISAQKQNLWKLLSESVPDKKELDVLCVLNDYFNIKASVKCLISGVSPEDYLVMPTTLNLELIKDKLSERDFNRVFKSKGETAEKAYETAVKSENGQSAEIIIDRAAIDLMAKFAEDSKDKTLREINAFFCDSTNIKIALRCALTKKDRTFVDSAIGLCRYISRERLIETTMNGTEALFEYLASTVYSEGAEEFRNNGAAFEKWCDKRIIQIASGARFSAFSFGAVCNYYYKKLTEIKNVGMILTALKVGADMSEIRERIGESDV